MRTLRARAIRFPLRRRRFAERFFGIRLPVLGPEDYYYDLVTLALFQAAKRLVPPSRRVLDMGCGAHAILGLALHARGAEHIVACDVNPALVELARANAARNRARIELRQSEFFSALDGESFDLVLFNPPYVPRRDAARMGLPEGDRRSQWDGGEDGSAVLRRFLDEFAVQRPGTLALVGCNRWWLGRDAVRALLDARPELALERMSSRRWWPGEVYWIRRLSAGPRR